MGFATIVEQTAVSVEPERGTLCVNALGNSRYAKLRVELVRAIRRNRRRVDAGRAVIRKTNEVVTEVPVSEVHRLLAECAAGDDPRVALRLRLGRTAEDERSAEEQREGCCDAGHRRTRARAAAPLTAMPATSPRMSQMMSGRAPATPTDATAGALGPVAPSTMTVPTMPGCRTQ